MSDTPDTPTLPPSPPSTARPGTSPSAAPPENVVSLSRFRARHARDARQRALDGLLDARSPEAAVRALPGETLHDLVGRGDPREHLDVLVHARPEQIQTVFDLALWSGDRLAPSRIEPWIATLAALPSEVVTRFVAGLDVELVALLIRKGARIYDLEIEAPPDEPQGTFYSTPDGFFVLDVTGYRVESDPAASQGATEAAVGAPDSGEVATPDAASGASEASADALIHVVDNLYKGDLDFARRILVGAKAELDSELEEMAFRWRQGRLQDLGFEDAAAAREVYRPLDPASVRIGELRPGTRVRPLASGEADGAAGAPPERTRLPAPLEAELEGESVFARARARVTDSAERDELDVALYALANRVLAAAGVDPGDEDAGSAHLARLRGTLDLGIDYLARRSGGFDEDRAVDAVRTIAIGRIFRVGVSLTAKVRSLATALRKGAPFAGSADDLNLVEEPEATVLEAALRPHPTFPRLLDEPPASGERPIASVADLARLTAAIERAAAAQILLLGLGVTPAALELATGDGVEPADRAAIDTAVLARTALVLALLSRGPAPGAADGFRPLTPLEIGRFSKAAAPAVLSRARTLLEGLAPEAMTRAAREMAARWVSSLAPLEPVLVRRARAPRKAPSRPRRVPDPHGDR